MNLSTASTGFFLYSHIGDAGFFLFAFQLVMTCPRITGYRRKHDRNDRHEQELDSAIRHDEISLILLRNISDGYDIFREHVLPLFNYETMVSGLILVRRGTEIIECPG